MRILIEENHREGCSVRQRDLRRWAVEALRAMGLNTAELSILLVDDGRITELNRAYLGREGPTNVIAFPMQQGEGSGINPDILGDIVISLDTAHREAQASDSTLEERIKALLIHGLLHLLGYDHEGSEEEARLMEAKEEELLKKLQEDLQGDRPL